MMIFGAVLLVGAVVLTLFLWKIRERRLERFEPMDELEGHDFEYYCADVLRSRGFVNVSVTKGSGDYGADILAEKDGVTYAVQCKCYSQPIGVAAVQQALAGREYYEKMVGAVLTNSYYTRSAREAAEKMRILLWDREFLEEE